MRAQFRRGEFPLKHGDFLLAKQLPDLGSRRCRNSDARILRSGFPVWRVLNSNASSSGRRFQGQMHQMRLASSEASLITAGVELFCLRTLSISSISGRRRLHERLRLQASPFDAVPMSAEHLRPGPHPWLRLRAIRASGTPMSTS